MKTKLRQNKDIYVISLEENLDVIEMDRFKSLCNSSFKKSKIIFNLKSLNFVGSSGIDVFLETLEFLKQNNELKLCHVSSEFKKVFDNENLGSLICDNEEEAFISLKNKQD